ncbi:MAG: hypothetical protein PHI63_00455 [Patescibacteria group bacterium]|nr:hypothetical protein [Patescibacteria group bacterium]
MKHTLEKVQRIFLVTHAEQLGDSSGNWIPDPGMTEVGRRVVAQLKRPLEMCLNGKPPTAVFAGTGRRHWEVTQILGLKVERVKFCSIFGEAAILINPFQPHKKVLLSHGLIIDWDQYLHTTYRKALAREAILGLPDGSVICGDQSLLGQLNHAREQRRGGALFQLTVHPGSERIDIKAKHFGELFPAKEEETED